MIVMPTNLKLAMLLLLFFLALVASASDKQAEGKQLIDRALSLTDIRAEGSPGFRLHATFQVGDSTAKHGTYSELWLSNGRWQRETASSDFRHLEVAQAKKKWLLDTPGPPPLEAGAIVRALNPYISAGQFKVKEITDKQLNGKAVRCVKSENQFIINLYCVDPTNSELVLQESLARSSSRHTTYLYGDYEVFGARVFPRSVQYKVDSEPGISIRVSELAETSGNISEFAPPPGAVELGNCPLSQMRAPVASMTPDPAFPVIAKASSSLVVLSMIVGSDGLAHNIQVVRSGGDAFDREAMGAVAHWRFKPATCLQEPVGAQINVEVQFRR